MSISQLQQTNQCCQNKKVYTVTYQKDGQKITFNVCESCIYDEVRSEIKLDTLIKTFQRNAIEIICNTCNEDVTATMGCKTCHPESFSNSQNTKETKF